MLEQSRVVKIAAERPQGHELGSGYIVAPGLVLTARHVVADAIACRVMPVAVKEWIEGGVVVWQTVAGGHDDVALVRVDDPRVTADFASVIRWGQYGRQRRVEWEGCGFPEAAEVTRPGDTVRESCTLSGYIEPHGNLMRGLLELSVGAGPDADGWRGISGAAVFAEGLLVGIIRGGPSMFKGQRLSATPLAELLARSPLLAELLDYPAPAPVDARGAAGVCLVPRRDDVPFCGRVDECEQLTRLLASSARVIIVSGDSGVGKSRVATQCAIRFYETRGGTVGFVAFQRDPAGDIAKLGPANGVAALPGEALPDFAQRVLATRPPVPTLLVYDDVETPDALLAWLPGDPFYRVLVTSTYAHWPHGYATMSISRLPDADARAIATTLAPAATAAEVDTLCARAAGITMQLVADATATDSAHRHGRTLDHYPIAATTEQSYERAWSLLDPDAQVVLRIVASYRTEVPTDVVHGVLRAEGWSERQFCAAEDRIVERRLTWRGNDDEPTLHVHALVRAFARVRAVPADSVRAYQAREFGKLAAQAAAAPANGKIRARFLVHDLTPDDWRGTSVDEAQVATALSELGRFSDALLWAELALKKDEGDVMCGAGDHRKLGHRLEQVGRCLSQNGRSEEALPFFQRAVSAFEQVDVHGRVRHECLAHSLERVGYWYSQRGWHEQALPFFKRAAAEVELGNTFGLVNHATLGVCLQQIGACLSQSGQDEEALRYFLRAVTESERGDDYGRIHHVPLAVSLDSVGERLLRGGRYADALRFYQRAVTEFEQGDLHRRVDHARLGVSLHQVGTCLSRLRRSEEALPYFRRAVTEAEQGNVHGRVDHARLAISLHQVGHSLTQLGQHDEALPFFQRAVAEAQQGDIRGRVDIVSLIQSTRALATCRTRVKT